MEPVALYSFSWLERANRLALIAQQLSTTVHDVNNTLQVISGSAELLQHGPDAAEVARRAKTIEAQAQKAFDLLSDLTAFTRDTNATIEPLDLHAIVEQALAMRRHSLTRLRVTVVGRDRAAASVPDVVVHANARRLLQIVLNLIVNAEQTLAGRPAARLTIDVRHTSAGAQIVVEDNGPGLPATSTVALNEPGADGTVQRLGIGLAVSQWLASEMKGTLRDSAGSLGGTRWSLTLPL
jgi:C4-dicarboxylate-specific signal transduction histidine kinase